MFICLDGENIDVMKYGTYDFALRTIAFYQFIFLFQLLCLLEFQLFGQGQHLFLQGLADALRISLQNLFNLGDVLHVCLVRLKPDTGSLTVLDMIFQADLELVCLNILGSQCQCTGTDGIEFLNQFQYGHHGWYVAVGTEVGRPVADNLPRLEDTREILVAYADGRVGLVIFQQDIVARLVFLDEVVLQQQRVFFCIYDDVSDVCNLAYQNPCLGGLVFFRKIGVDTPLQILCFSHVDNGPLLIQVLVDSRTFGQVQDNSS